MLKKLPVDGRIPTRAYRYACLRGSTAIPKAFLEKRALEEHFLSFTHHYYFG